MENCFFDLSISSASPIMGLVKVGFEHAFRDVRVVPETRLTGFEKRRFQRLR